MSGRRNHKTGTVVRSVADQRQIAWQAEVEPGAVVEGYPWPGFGALGLDNQSAVHLTTLETWTRRASAQLCRLQHFADGSGANGVAQIV